MIHFTFGFIWEFNFNEWKVYAYLQLNIIVMQCDIYSYYLCC